MTAPEVEPSAASSAPPTLNGARGTKGRPWLRALPRIGAGLVAGLVIAEVVFRLRDQGAFPHLNVYEPDAELGARLKPGATEKVRFGPNPVTSVRINSQGFRGDEWPAAGADEIIVVGDSQVFGLGVEESETFSAQLQRALGEKRVVRNLGVPTYGPPEYLQVIEQQLTARPAKTVIYTVNMANDLFEAGRPNKLRHAVWDGWAVRKESAPAQVQDFPGRSWLFGKSHGVYALRRYLYERGLKDTEQGFASEGTFRDIEQAAVTAAQKNQQAEREATEDREALRVAQGVAQTEVGRADLALLEAIRRDQYELLNSDAKDWDKQDYVPLEAVYQAGRLSPGDIVTKNFGEESRGYRITAEHIRRGAALRERIDKETKARAEARRDKELLALFASRDAAEKSLAELRFKKPAPKPALSPLADTIKRVKATCDKHGAKLLVVALPMDVQVSKDEWAKYGAPPVDMSATKVLLDDIVYAAEVAGARGYDATKVLAAAEPGAFLYGDLHMTPKGHKALAEGIKEALTTPHFKVPQAGLPPGRSALPRANEWTPQTEIAVTESDPAGCETKRVREWVGIFCRAKGGGQGVVLHKGIEAQVGTVPGASMLIAPAIPGQDLHATFALQGNLRDFTIKVADAAASAEIAFSKPLAKPSDVPRGVSPGADAYCSCAQKQVAAGKACSDLNAVPSETCARTYAGNCERLLACTEGVESAMPACGTGEAQAGAAHRCTPLCTDAVPCAKGTCSEWQEGRVCL